MSSSFLSPLFPCVWLANNALRRKSSLSLNHLLRLVKQSANRSLSPRSRLVNNSLSQQRLELQLLSCLFFISLSVNQFHNFCYQFKPIPLITYFIYITNYLMLLSLNPQSSITKDLVSIACKHLNQT